MPNYKLKEYLTPVGAFALAFGCAVGWGAFVMPATVFLPLGGPLGVALGMTIGGVIMLIIGYNYYFLMRRHRDAGGTYAFSKFSFGHDHGFIASWFLLLVFLAITWANVTALVLIFRNLAGSFLQFGFDYSIAGYHVYMGEVLAEMLAILAFGALAMYKKALAVKIQTAFAFLMLIGITAGLLGAINANGLELFQMQPDFPPNKAPALAVLGIVVLAPWAFAGFESISNSAEEFKFNTKKSFIVMALAVVCGIYAYIALSYVAISANPKFFGNWVSYLYNLDGLSGLYSLPVFNAVDKNLGGSGLVLLGLTLFAATMTGLLGNTIAGSRLLYAMARDNMLPSYFKKLTRDGSPRNTILFVMLISLPIPFIGRSAISWLIDVNTIGATVAYAYTSAAALKAAKAEHNAKVIVTGALGLILSVFFLYFIVPWEFSTGNLARESYLILIVWSILGFIFFRYIFKRDRARLFGKSTVVWFTLLAMVFFSSMLWMRESVKDSVNETLGRLNTHHLTELKNYGLSIDRNEEKEIREFYGKNLTNVEADLTFHNIMQVIILGIALYIMFNVYNLMMIRERKTEIEKTLMEKETVAKSTFFFNMSHDIRTPMNAIIGYVNLLKKENLDEQTEDYLLKIESASNNLLSLINDILEVSRIENNKFTLEITATNIKNCIVEVEDMFKTQMQGKNLKYAVETSAKNEWVAADGKRLNRVLLNLVSNAYKFTPEGGFVSVALNEIEREEFLARTGAYIKGNAESVTENILSNPNANVDPNIEISDKFAYYEIRVKDSGIGMSDEFAATVFDAYARDRSVADIQGTGLGMSITKSIIDMMYGSIRVESKKGQGTTFIINLAFPLLAEHIADDSEETEGGEKSFDLNGLRVLLVEDVEMNREIAAMILSEVGVITDTAENGQIALEKVIASEENPYDLVLMDIQMPVMNGYDATKAIRQLNNETLRNIPIIAMTANAFQEDVDNAKKAGMNAHIAKPLDIPKMLKTIEEVLS